MTWNWSPFGRSTARPTRCAGRRALTVVELNVAVLVGTILALSVVAALVAGAGIMTDTQRRVALKQDAAYALRFIQRRVRTLYTDELLVSEEGTCLTIQVEGEPARTFQQNEGDLEYFDGADIVALVDDKLQSVTFALVDGYNEQDLLLSILLALQEEDLTGTMPECRVLIRNRVEDGDDDDS